MYPSFHPAINQSINPICLPIYLPACQSGSFVFQFQKPDGVFDVILSEVHAMGVHF
jgi:hypothetical protein